MSVESSTLDVGGSSPRGAVFLSYASQDAEAAKRIADALRGAGIEVWFDQNELVGGDQWDAKIRKQLAACALFLPLISAATQARREGYFRLEWKLAAQRTHMMSDQVSFLLPIVIDATPESAADVPAEFRSVQWTRLPAGETPPTLVARVKKLLVGEGGRDRPIPSSSPEARASDPVRKIRPASKWWLALPILGVAMAGMFFIRAGRTEPVNPPTPGAAMATPTDAQKLVRQAQAIYANGDELDRETLLLADDLVKRALVLDPAEQSAWELGAKLSYFMVWQSVDVSEARKAELERQAARARALAPESLSAQLVAANAKVALAYANSQSASNRQDLAALEPDLLAMARRAPQDYQIQRTLGQIYRFLKRPEEALRMFQHALASSGGDPAVSADVINHLMRRKRYAEAEAMIAPALARRPIGRMVALDVVFKTMWRGDLTAAQAALAAWPSWLLREDRGAFLAWQTWMWSHQPEQALGVAEHQQRDYLRDNFFTGPRAVLTARAHEMAGHTEAAEADWRTVIRLTDRELATAPEAAAAYFWKAWAQTRLGDLAGAQATVTLLQQRALNSGSFFKTTSLALLWSTMGRTDLAAEHLRASFGAIDDAYAVTRAMLELDPAYAPLRADPQFAKLAAAAPAPTAPARAGGPDHAPPEPKSVAVLAFDNRSEDKAAEFFSDGVSEELINALGRVPGLTVKGRTSAFFFKGRNATAQEIAEKLGVSYLVRGSVRKSGGKVRITVQLSRAATDEVIWSSDPLDRDLEDVFAVQDEIVALIAKNLSVQMGVVARAAHAVNPDALTALMEGRQFWVLRTPVGFARARELFTRAVTLDPAWAPAHAALANLEVIEASFLKGSNIAVEDRFERGARAARRALELDPTLGEPHAALGKIAQENRRLTESEQEFRQALALEPNNALVNDWYGDLAVLRGHLDLAIASYRRALELEPLSPYILWDLAWELLNVRRYDQALVLVERAAALTPEGATRLSLRRARLLMEAGRRDEANAALLTFLQKPKTATDAQYINEAVWCLRTLASPADRERWSAELLRQYPDSYASGVILLMQGDEDRAYPLLEKVPPIFWQQLYWEPVFDPVRETPRFRQLLAKVGCVAEYQVARATQARLLREDSVQR